MVRVTVIENGHEEWIEVENSAVKEFKDGLVISMPDGSTKCYLRSDILRVQELVPIVKVRPEGIGLEELNCPKRKRTLWHYPSAGDLPEDRGTCREERVLFFLDKESLGKESCVAEYEAESYSGRYDNIDNMFYNDDSYPYDTIHEYEPQYVTKWAYITDIEGEAT